MILHTPERFYVILSEHCMETKKDKKHIYKLTIIVLRLADVAYLRLTPPCFLSYVLFVLTATQGLNKFLQSKLIMSYTDL